MKKILVILFTVVCVSCGKFELINDNPAANNDLIGIINQMGGSISFSEYGTGISRDGQTDFTIRTIDKKHIGVAVSGATGNGVEFTNDELKMKVRKGEVSVNEEDLRQSRYNYFYLTFGISEDLDYMTIEITYETAAYASFVASETIYIGREQLPGAEETL